MGGDGSSRRIRVLAALAVVLSVMTTHAVGVAGDVHGTVQGSYQASAEVNALSDADPNEPSVVVQAFWQGIDLVREGRWEEARSWFTNGISRYPRQPTPSRGSSRSPLVLGS